LLYRNTTTIACYYGVETVVQLIHPFVSKLPTLILMTKKALYYNKHIPLSGGMSNEEDV